MNLILLICLRDDSLANLSQKQIE